MEELLDCKTINLGLVNGLANSLEYEYDFVLSYFYDEMEKNYNGDILIAIKKTISLLCKRIKLTLQLIQKIKEENNGGRT